MELLCLYRKLEKMYILLPRTEQVWFLTNSRNGVGWTQTLDFFGYIVYVIMCYIWAVVGLSSLRPLRATRWMRLTIWFKVEESEEKNLPKADSGRKNATGAQRCFWNINASSLLRSYRHTTNWSNYFDVTSTTLSFQRYHWCVDRDNNTQGWKRLSSCQGRYSPMLTLFLECWLLILHQALLL